MRVAIADIQVPFISGGGEALAQGLLRACREAGFETELVTMPFRFSPNSEIERAIQSWELEDFGRMNGYSPDITVCLRFPSYCLSHHRKVVWLLHQHRALYDLWDPTVSDVSPEKEAARRHLIDQDTRHLASLEHRYTISQNVTNRLRRFNGLSSIALYHPPPMAGKLYWAEPEAYIFAPSRLETLKRQWLLIEAMQHVRAPVVTLIAGAGGQENQYQELIERLGLSDRVRLLGRLPESELATFYACSLAVFFGPVDEDYGYVTLEAMLARKPVITCADSGGPLEFVIDNDTGLVVDPVPEAVAAAIETLYANQKQAADWGRAGYQRYQKLDLSWHKVVDQLIGSSIVDRPMS